MEFINDLVMSLAASPWVYLITFLVVVIDGFFPPIPSESILVAVAALATSTGNPHLILLVAVAGLGAVGGDHIAYAIGRFVGMERFRWMRNPRVARATAWARAGLQKRAATLILTGRFIPVGRVAVSMTAGATRFSRRRFFLLTMVAGFCWAIYSVTIGLIAGAWFTENPILGAAIAIVVAIILGIVLDAVIAAISRLRDARHPVAEQERARDEAEISERSREEPTVLL